MHVLRMRMRAVRSLGKSWCRASSCLALAKGHTSFMHRLRRLRGPAKGQVGGLSIRIGWVQDMVQLIAIVQKAWDH